MHELPECTLRDLGLLAGIALETIRVGVQIGCQRLRPWLEPPSDLTVESAPTHTYSGLLFVDANQVLAALVAQRAASFAPQVEDDPLPSWRSSVPEDDDPW